MSISDMFRRIIAFSLVVDIGTSINRYKAMKSGGSVISIFITTLKKDSSFKTSTYS